MKEQVNKMTEQEIQASSIGNTFPPIKEMQMYDEGNKRLKGFCTEAIDSSSELEKWVSGVEKLHSFLTQRDRIDSVTRTTLRFVVNEGVTIPESISGGIEAVLPLDGKFRGYNLVYFGRNHETRRAPEDKIETQRATAEKADKEVQFKGDQSLRILRYTEKPGLIFQNIKAPFEREQFSDLVRRLVVLYNKTYLGDYAFPITEETVSSILSRNTNVVIAAKDKFTNDIYSVAVGETASIPISVGGKVKNLSIAEISDAASDPDGHQERGYYSTIVCELARELVKLGMDVVYSETRAQSEAVLRATRKSGLRLMRDLKGRASILHKHCIIGGARNEELDERDGNKDNIYNGFENLIVWHATRKDLMDVYA